MKNSSFYLMALAVSIALLPCSPAKADDARPAANTAPAPVSLSMPSMAGPLTGPAEPYSFDTGAFLGKVYVTGAATAIDLKQSKAAATDRSSLTDISNGQVFVQNADGPFQFFVEAGAYSTPALGTPYTRMDKTTDETYGLLPQGYIKYAPDNAFSLEAGKLPTLFGAEDTFTFENMNIERGLLWNQENAVNRGVQGNYTRGPLSLSLSWNDGFYSNHFNWLTGAATYTIDGSNSLEFVAGGSLSRTSRSSVATPLAQNNSSIYNIIYTHTAGPWTFNPYLQYTHVPEDAGIGLNHAASTYGAAMLVKYNFNTHFSLSGRAEYTGSGGSAANGAPNLLYGPGSRAWSLTVTPAYQYKDYFVRVDASYVGASGTAAGDAFGSSGNSRSQGRVMLEVGMLF